MTISRDLADLVPTLRESGGDIGQGTTTPATPDGTNADNPLNGVVNTIYGASPGINLVASAGTGWSLVNFGRAGGTSNPYRAVIGYDQTNDILVMSARNYLGFRVNGAVNSALTMTLNAAGGLQCASTVGVGDATPASGAGITFPATQSASTDANTLDDYEEGTFTPTVSGSSSAGTGTYSKQVGSYTKVGRQVSVNVWVEWSAHTGTGNLQLTNLPFTSNSTTNLYSSVTFGWTNNLALTAGKYPVAHIPNGQTRIDVYQFPTGGGAFESVAIDTDSSIMYSATYYV